MPKIVDHDKRRFTIAQAAVTVIAEQGLEATKLSDIARLAGMTTGSVSHYFSGKDAVLMAALEMSYDMMFADMAEVSASEELQLLRHYRASLANNTAKAHRHDRVDGFL